MSAYTFEKNKPEVRQQIAKHSDEVRKFVKERSRWESKDQGQRPGGPVVKHVPPGEAKEKTKQVKRQKAPTKQEERMKSAPARRTGGGAEPGSGRKNLTTPPQQQRPSKVSPGETKQKREDKVKVRTPPVVDKQRGASRRKEMPSRPAQEMPQPVKAKGSETKPSKQKKSAPAARTNGGAESGSGRKNLTTPPQQPGQPKVSPAETKQRREDKVKVRTQPVKGKGSEPKPAKQKKSPPAETTGGGAGQGKERRDSAASPQHQKSKKVDPDEIEEDQLEMMEDQDSPMDNRKGKSGGKGGGKR